MSKRQQTIRGRTRHSGMTLIEVLVAMTILAVGIAAVLGAFASTVRAHKASEEYTQAVMLAQEALVELQHQPTLVIGQTSGTLEDIIPGYRWEAEIEEGAGDGLLPVRMVILWGSDAAPRHYDVRTYLRQPAEAQPETGGDTSPAGGAP